MVGASAIGSRACGRLPGCSDQPIGLATEASPVARSQSHRFQDGGSAATSHAGRAL